MGCPETNERKWLHVIQDRLKTIYYFSGSCKSGSYYDVISHKCLKCPRGTYQHHTSETFCYRCPRNTTTLERGAKDKSRCIGKKIFANFNLRYPHYKTKTEVECIFIGVGTYLTKKVFDWFRSELCIMQYLTSILI